MNEPTNNEILETISDFANKTERRFENLEDRMGGLEDRMGGLEDRMGGLEGRVRKIKSEMLTKDYFDEKLFDLRGDIISVVKKEDVKVGKLIEILIKKKVISKKEAQIVFSMEPFPQIFT